MDEAAEDVEYNPLMRIIQEWINGGNCEGLKWASVGLSYKREGYTIHSDAVSMTIVIPDMDLGWVYNEDETCDGAYIVLNDDDDDCDGVMDIDDEYNKDGVAGNDDDTNGSEDDLVELYLYPVIPTDPWGDDEVTGTVRLKALSGGDKIKVWTDDKKGEGNELSLPAEFVQPDDLTGEQKKVYVEGVAVSDNIRDIELAFELSIGGKTFEDRIKVTVVGLRKIALGSSANLSKVIVGKIYEPTTYGGTLTVTGGSNTELFYTDGSDLDLLTAEQVLNDELDEYIVGTGNPCEYDVPYTKYGWYYVKITDSSATSVSNTFVQEADTGPGWDCYWWPKLEHDLYRQYVHLYDADGALDKYDQWHIAKYGGASPGVKDWEYNHHRTTELYTWWWGHCDVACAAVIHQTEPDTSTEEGISFSELDKQGLLVAIWENYQNEFEIHEDDGPEDGADDIHKRLEECVKQDNQKVAVDNCHDEYEGAFGQWNYVVNGYSATMTEKDNIPEKVNVTLNLDQQQGTEYTYHYWLEYSTSTGVVSSGGWIYPETGAGKERRRDLLWRPESAGTPPSPIDPAKALDIVY